MVGVRRWVVYGGFCVSSLSYKMVGLMDILRGKTAVVGGASQGIGRAVARVLAAWGARVIALARSGELLQQLVEELESVGARGHGYRVVDFEDVVEVEAVACDILAEVSVVHILVNNTGGPPSAPLLVAEAGDFERAMRRHLLAFHTLTKVFVPGMQSARYGRIINIASTSVKAPIDGLGVSNTVRAAVANWAKTLAVELGPYGITVNTVLPGATATERLSSLIRTWAERRKVSVDALARQMEESIPLKRFASPEEIAHVVAFVASPWASYLNGVNLPVDGGRTRCV